MPVMTQTQLESLKAHYLDWSGDTVPETEEDIAVYVDAAILTEFDPAAATAALRAWMREAASLEVRGDVDEQ